MRLAFVSVAFACSSPAQSEPLPVPRPATVTVAKIAPEITVTSRIGDAQASGKVTSVRVAAAVDDGAADERPAYARADQRVTLYAVMEVDDHGKRTVYTDAPAL